MSISKPFFKDAAVRIQTNPHSKKTAAERLIASLYGAVQKPDIEQADDGVVSMRFDTSRREAAEPKKRLRG